MVMLMKINERIKQVRQELGLSQAKFAAGISISNGYIAGLELGNRNDNERIIKLICATYNVNEDWLKTGDGVMFNSSVDPRTEHAAAIFQRLNPKFQKYALEQIEKLLELQSQSECEDTQV